MRITQKDIAIRLGVSRSLVAGVLNNDPSVGATAAKRERILAASRDMGYRPNPIARALATGRTKVIGVWMPAPSSAFYANFLREVQRVAHTDDRQLMISESSDDFESPHRGMPQWNWPVDGILAIDSNTRAEMHIASRSSIPLVSIGMGKPGSANFVLCDMLEASREAVRHLIRTGRRRIVHLAPRFTADRPDEDRHAAFLAETRAAGLSSECIYLNSWFDREESCAKVIERFRSPNRPDALFCFSDDLAIGAYHGIRQFGLRIPEDVAIIGCGNIEDGRYHAPALSTLDLRNADLCRLGWDMLQRLVSSQELASEQEFLHARFIARDSA